MNSFENAWRRSLGRRAAFRALAGFLAGSPLLRSQQDLVRDHGRVPRLDELVTALDFEPVAFAKVPRAAYDYTAYGSAGEFTLRRNREAFDWVKLAPRSVADVSSLQTSIELFGNRMPFPILISPTAAQAALHPDGEMAMYQGATAANTTMIVSNVSSFPYEKIATGSTGPLWFQLYPRQDLEDNLDLLAKAQTAGCRAVVVTIDQQAAYYERSMHGRNLGMGPGRLTRQRSAPRNPYRIEESRMWYEWKFFERIRPHVKVPMIAKGILTAEDARLCLENGLDAIYVSNHGGRALDYSPSTLEVLPEIVDAVRGRVPVLFDSGIRRGADILKALALGATAVCLGRVPRWGLAAYGAAGVQKILEITQAELQQTMALTGTPSLASINRSLVRTDFP